MCVRMYKGKLPFSPCPCVCQCQKCYLDEQLSDFDSDFETDVSMTCCHDVHMFGSMVTLVDESEQRDVSDMQLTSEVVQVQSVVNASLANFHMLVLDDYSMDCNET